MLQLRRSAPLALLFLLVLTSSSPVRADKELPAPLREIRDAKARGERYMGMTWHAAEALYLKTRAAAEDSRHYAARAGGSDAVTATLVDANPYQDQDTTVGKGNDSVGGGCLNGGDDVSEDAWYKFTFATSVDLTVSTTCASIGPASFDTRLSLYDENLVLLTCNDDAPDCGQPYYQSSIENVLLPAGTYYVVVDGYNGVAGPYEFNASWTEGPEVCDGSNSLTATQITTLPWFDSASTSGACDDILVDCELQAGSSGPDYWYRLDLDTAVLLDARTSCDALDIDSRIAILDSDFETLYCNDDDPLCPSHQSEIENAFLDAGIYYIVVDSPDGAGGMFNVEVDTTHAPAGEVQTLLPDVTVVESDLYDNYVTDTVEPGKVHLRLSNAAANLGEGKLYLYGVNPGLAKPTHEVRQRIWRTDGTWYDRAAGQFVYHPGHNHIHIDGWNQYNLREILPGDGVGPIIASGTKTSFCIIDLRVEDPYLPGYPQDGEFLSCDSTIQGLSVGWADIYSKNLADQWIDVTGVAEGTYWLESVVDPADNIKETDETNNVARIQVTIGAPGEINPDPFEPNADSLAVVSRPPGQNNSPNLGPCGPSRTIRGLTLHEPGREDWFRFYQPGTGTVDDFVRIEFVHASGDLDMKVYRADGSLVGVSQTYDDEETVLLDGEPEGWYHVQVYEYDGFAHPSYDLTIDPAENGAPTITVTDPPPGDVELVQAIDAYPVHWTSGDPEGNETWVSIWVNAQPQLDGNEIFLETSLHTPAELGTYILATTYLPVGTYYVYAEITDGGASSGDWSEGTMTLINQLTSTPGVHRSTRLLPPLPNPFNPSTLLRLELGQHEDHLEWNIYDVRGAKVRQLMAGHLHEGLHERRWDGRDDDGRAVASGVYFAVVRGSGLQLSQKLVLLK